MCVFIVTDNTAILCAMKVDLTQLSLRLDAGNSLRLHDALGLSIRAVRGVLWITQEGDGRDHIVGLAERFVIGHAGLTIVSAVTQAELCMEKQAEAA